jgi:hypothetical protein
MANKEQFATIRRGIGAWNQWRQAHAEIRPDLQRANLAGAYLLRANLAGAYLLRANLAGANLAGANLVKADLAGVDLTGANLAGADLREALVTEAQLREVNLTGANLNGAELTRADLTGADLTGADLTHAHLYRSDFTQANLRGADMHGAIIGETVFAETGLSHVKRLETVQHRGPSSIGVDTLINSGGTIPEIFLSGCGVPDSLIEYLPSLIGAMQPIQFYSCFISYSSKDEEFAKRLHQRMRAENLRVWFAPDDIKGGEKLYEQIERAIQLHDRLLLVLTEQSMQSDWVTTELYNARQAEIRENRRKLFPIRLCDFEILRAWKCFNADTGKDLAREVREYFIPDFSDWKNHDTFEVAFARLIKDLRATETRAAL